MNTITIHAKNEHDLGIFITLAKRLNAVVEREDEPYNPEFVTKIKKSQSGKKIELTPELQRELLGL